jgi:hypothetical protein
MFCTGFLCYNKKIRNVGVAKWEGAQHVENTYEELNQIGSEGGKVLKDEEYKGQCRITLERCPHYDAITCGVYGEMVHTAYADVKESSSTYELMKKELQKFIDADFEDEEKRSEFYEVFVNRF